MQVFNIESLNTFEVQWHWKRPELSKPIFEALEVAIKKAMDPKEISESMFLTGTGRKAEEGEEGAVKAIELLHVPDWYRSVGKVTKRCFTPYATFDGSKDLHLQLEWS